MPREGFYLFRDCGISSVFLQQNAYKYILALHLLTINFRPFKRIYILSKIRGF